VLQLIAEAVCTMHEDGECLGDASRDGGDGPSFDSLLARKEHATLLPKAAGQPVRFT
jgi:hypothetical protein